MNLYTPQRGQIGINSTVKQTAPGSFVFSALCACYFHDYYAPSHTTAWPARHRLNGKTYGSCSRAIQRHCAIRTGTFIVVLKNVTVFVLVVFG
jgi:hypothetical protein